MKPNAWDRLFYVALLAAALGLGLGWSLAPYTPIAGYALAVGKFALCLVVLSAVVMALSVFGSKDAQ